MNNSHFLRPAYASFTSEQLLNQPVSAILAISELSSQRLGMLGIKSIFDLGSSQLFGAARQILNAALADHNPDTQTFSGDLINDSGIGKSIKEIADFPIEAMRMLDEAKAKAIQDDLGIATIRELAAWPAYNIARAIINDAYGQSATGTIMEDDERPNELVPVMRKYAVEKVQYDVIVMDKILEPVNLPVLPEMLSSMDPMGQENSTVAMDFKPDPKWQIYIDNYNKGLHDLTLAGGIDISDIVASALIVKPAIGAVLTYRQSWFPQGLALGHLLHSMALAPGESTRVAMVDWTRQVRANTTEDTTQVEQLLADINRTRAMSEVTASVAKEAQSGFSEMKSDVTQTQYGTTSGSSSLGSSFEGSADAEWKDKKGPTIKGGANYAFGVSSAGTSDARSQTVGWASSQSSTSGDRTLNAAMLQNINDRTHQASNSVRNRRATTVVETTQQEKEQLSTRVVTNYNHMHALTVQYFEVVQIYKVILELSRVTPCLFVPMKLVTFTEQVIRRYRDVIAKVGIVPEVRALAFAEPSQLAITAFDKIGSWTGTESLKIGLGYDVTTPSSKTVFLPLSGLKFYSVGSNDPKVFQHYESIIITDKKGGRFSFNLFDAKMNGFSNAWSPDYVCSLSKIEQITDRNGNILNGNYIAVPSEISTITFKKKETSIDFEGSISAILKFDIGLSEGKLLSGTFDAPALTIGSVLNVKKGEIETPIFSFQLSITNENLIRHLEENALHYSTVIWRSMDAPTITTLLASYYLHGKRLIENIDPVPVQVSGNYIIFRYYGIDKSEWSEFSNKHELTKPQPLEDLIPLPSGGVFAEAVLGRANAAEKLDITRFWNWQDSPIPILPPEINALTAGGKDNAPNLQTGKLESPLVNIINPPALPDPVGLAPVYAAIANSNMFRDMSGNTNTSSLLQSALQAAQAAATNASQASGDAQKVAANQLTDILKIAAQIAAGAMGVPTGGIEGGGGGLSTRPNLPATPTNKGIDFNAGKKLDEDEWLPYPGSDNLTPPPLLNADPLENKPKTRPSNKHRSAILHGTPATSNKVVANNTSVRFLFKLDNVVDSNVNSEHLEGLLNISLRYDDQYASSSEGGFSNKKEIKLPNIIIRDNTGSKVISDILENRSYEVGGSLMLLKNPRNIVEQFISAFRIQISEVEKSDTIKQIENFIRGQRPKEIPCKGIIINIQKSKTEETIVKLNIRYVVKSLTEVTIDFDVKYKFALKSTSTGKLSFDSSQLGKFIEEILKDTEYKVAGEILQFFTLSGSFEGSVAHDGTINTGASLKFHPKYLEGVEILPG